MPPVARRPLNYTTNVPVSQTVGEVQQLLAGAGADKVAVSYDAGQPVGVEFTLRTPHGDRVFRLPVEVEQVHGLLLMREDEGLFASLKKRNGTFTSTEHAARVAWRVAKDWLEAVIALLDARMARVDQVMLPYLVGADDRTLYARYREQEDALALEAGDAR